MTNIRLMPAGNGKTTTMTANGRSYTCALGATIDVPDFDAFVLGANGWIQVAPVGTTSQRPAKPGVGNFGGYQAIQWDAKNKVYWGATEMRKDGEVIGY